MQFEIKLSNHQIYNQKFVQLEIKFSSPRVYIWTSFNSRTSFQALKFNIKVCSIWDQTSEPSSQYFAENKNWKILLQIRNFFKDFVTTSSIYINQITLALYFSYLWFVNLKFHYVQSPRDHRSEVNLFK